MDLSGQTAVVTGASRGIGRAIAMELASCGANVALWSRRADDVAAVADDLAPDAPGRIAARGVDVRKRQQIDAAVRAAADLAPVTLLVNNAGTAGPAGLDWEADPHEWWQCVETSLLGSFLCEQAIVPGMLERGSGRVVEIVSVTGTTAFPLLGATSVAKAALIRHAENFAVATADTGVSVFGLHPGTVDTELLASYRSNPQVAAFFDGMPPDSFTPPQVAARAAARIATGELDALSGCFVDATADLDALAGDDGESAGRQLRLRLA